MKKCLSTKPFISVKKYEQQVGTVERFPLILRCSSTLTISEYPYQKAAPSSWRISEWFKKRAKSCIPDHVEIAITLPNGKIANPRMTIGTGVDFI